MDQVLVHFKKISPYLESKWNIFQVFLIGKLGPEMARLFIPTLVGLGILGFVIWASMKFVPRSKKRQAKQFLKWGDYESAGNLYREIKAMDAAVKAYTKGQLFLPAAEIYLEMKQREKALTYFEKAGKLERAAKLAEEMKNFRKAALYHQRSGAHLEAAECYGRAGQWDQAMHIYETYGLLKEGAMAAQRAKNTLKAAQLFEKALQNNSQNFQSNPTPQNKKRMQELALYSSNNYMESGKQERGIQILIQGELYAKAAALLASKKHYEKAAKLYLQDKLPLKAAEMLEKIGKSKEAARLKGQHFKNSGQSLEAYENLKKSGDALEAAELAVELGKPAEAGKLYLKANELAMAAEHFCTAEIWDKAAECYEQIENFREAANCYGKAQDPSRQTGALEKGGFFLDAGLLYQKRSLLDKAIECLQRVSQVEVDEKSYREACCQLGGIFLERGELELAEQKLKQSVENLELSSTNIEAFFHLANIHEKCHRKNEALDIYTRILAEDYNYKDTLSRVNRLKKEISETPALAAKAPVEKLDPYSQTLVDQTRYEKIEEIGRGGMGVVYQARDKVLDRIVALKILPESVSKMPKAKEDFSREAKAAAALNHPNIVTIYDFGEEEGSNYIAMEFVEGSSLKQLLKENHPLQIDNIVHIIGQICEALNYAHTQGLVHRDIKTINIMVSPNGKAKLLDFGLAKAIRDSMNMLTGISGTPYYMSPEQTLGKPLDHRTDLYSLGVTLFEICSGQLPFREGDIGYHQVNTQAPDPKSLRTDLPDFLSAAIQKCLRKDPNERFQSANDLHKALKQPQLSVSVVSGIATD